MDSQSAAGVHSFTDDIISMVFSAFEGKTLGEEGFTKDDVMEYLFGDETIQISKKEYETLKQTKSELEKYEKVINCIKGENGGKCKVSDFLPIDNIPEDIKSKLALISHKINENFPIELEIPYKNEEPCKNQSLGNQIPKELKEYISKREELKDVIKFMKMKWSGYPDEKVKINGIDIPFLWEWKSMYGVDGSGVRIVISKFPNKRIPLTFNDCSNKYHLWVCLRYDKKTEDNENKKTLIRITEMNIHCISPNTVLNTKFELSTTESLIKSESSNGNIIKV